MNCQGLGPGCRISSPFGLPLCEGEKLELVDVEAQGLASGTLGSVGDLVVLDEDLRVSEGNLLGIQSEVDETGVDVRDELGRGDGVLDDTELGHTDSFVRLTGWARNDMFQVTS